MIQRSILGVLLCTFLFQFVISSSAAENETPPELPGLNVLFIAVDDLNDWIGCMQGHPQAFTPNIDRLAARGTLFTTAHCQGPICGPSRASLMSGLYPHSTGVYQQPKGNLLEEDTEHFRGKLLPEYFAKHGYKTMGVGKLTHGYSEQTAFQEYGGWKSGFGPKPPKKQRFNYHLPVGPYSGTQTDWGAFPDSDKEMPDFQSAKWAVEKLNEEHEKPFFLGVGMVRPHVPFYVPEKWFARFPLDEIQLPEVREEDQNDIPLIGAEMHELPKYPRLKWLRENNDEQFKKCVQAYLASIAFMDHQVGKVLDALEKSRYAENTIVVLFSDHGYHIGEKDRVAKHSLWEEATHVPLIISLPKQDFAQTTSLPVGLIDLYPTLVHLCGLPKNETNEGESLVPILFAQDTTKWREAILTTYAKGNYALRTEHLRLIRYEDGSFEMYDHRFDPHEFNNLAGPAQLNRIAIQRNWEIAQTLSALLPETEAPYHPATSPAPINKWFEEHYKKNGVGVLKVSN
ncbi:sulfatase [Planctomicrobium sp.]|nr:sulfatase [Planctomicrobium sp.]MDA7503815.1 sulfatase [bacterium]MDB4439676.1 sulfatase [Planctomicrobium sp.]